MTRSFVMALLGLWGVLSSTSRLVRFCNSTKCVVLDNYRIQQVGKAGVSDPRSNNQRGLHACHEGHQPQLGKDGQEG